MLNFPTPMDNLKAFAICAVVGVVATKAFEYALKKGKEPAPCLIAPAKPVAEPVQL